MRGLEFIQARKTQLKYYRSVPLFLRTQTNRFVLYKKDGETLDDMRIAAGTHPSRLFIRKKDKLVGIQEVQKAFHTRLREYITEGRFDKIRETVGHIVEETLAEPRSGSLEGVSETVGILVREFTKETHVIKNLIDVSAIDYTTVIHSINVMALVLAYANTVGCTESQKKILGISALLHDVGKTKINSDILKSKRPLTKEEFKIMQEHTIHGFRILDKCQFVDSEIKTTALQHHEKCDGSGYPHQRRNIDKTAQIVGLIDCYEALTNDDRLYRNSMAPLQALELLRGDVLTGKFNKDIFANFAQSLVFLYNP